MEKENCKIRIVLGNFEIEFVGPEDFVTGEMAIFRKEGLGKYQAIIEKVTPIIAAKAPVLADTEPQKSPKEKAKGPELNGVTLQDLATRDVAGSENEWVLIYSYWVCVVDKKRTFAWADIKEKYVLSGRHTEAREGSLSENLSRCVRKEWLTKLRKNVYSIKEEGITKAVEIIQNPKPKKKTSKTKKRKKLNKGRVK